jgi:hypothetical protein
MTIISALRKLRQEDHEFKASLGCIASKTCLKTKLITFSPFKKIYFRDLLLERQAWYLFLSLPQNTTKNFGHYL